MLGENENHVCGLPDARWAISIIGVRSTTGATFERAESVRPFIQTSASLPSCDPRLEVGLLVHLDRRAKPTIERAARCDAHSGQLIRNLLLHGGPRVSAKVPPPACCAAAGM